MKKMYWWRVLVILVGLLFLGIAYIFSNQLLFGICDNAYSFGAQQGCLDKTEKIAGEPLAIFSTALIFISLFIFFISDKTFLKWLRFTLIWIFLSFVAVVATPEKHSFMSLDPNKETVSIWMGSLFVVISLIMFVWSWVKKKAVNK